MSYRHHQSQTTICLLWQYITSFGWKKTCFCLSKPGVHNSNLTAGQNIFLDISKGQSWYLLTHSKGVFIKETGKINKICNIAGQIKSFRGPHLACGPYVVTNQGKLLTKHKVPWFVVRLELTLALPWPLDIHGSKISFYLNIVRKNVSCE